MKFMKKTKKSKFVVQAEYNSNIRILRKMNEYKNIDRLDV